jgi:hypothetical protein
MAFGQLAIRASFVVRQGCVNRLPTIYGNLRAAGRQDLVAESAQEYSARDIEEQETPADS